MQCDGCRSPERLAPGSALYRRVLVLTVILLALAAWHLAAWPRVPAPQASPRLAAALQPEATIPAPTPTPVPEFPTPTPTPQPRRYTVADGDTLFDIARKLGVSEDTIVQANDLADPEALQIGQELIVP